MDPLVCVRCGQRMSILAFVSDQHSINRILEHLDLRAPRQDKPPPAREILRVAEQGEGWGVPAAAPLLRLMSGRPRPRRQDTTGPRCPSVSPLCRVPALAPAGPQKETPTGHVDASCSGA